VFILKEIILREVAAVAQGFVAGAAGAENWINAVTSQYNRLVKINQDYLPQRYSNAVGNKGQAQFRNWLNLD
jgi:hypothetical protein